MLLYFALIALIQGITEFLPVSSSAHLILLPVFLGVQDQGTLTDVMAHFGSLGAVMLYFKQDVKTLVKGCFDGVTRKETSDFQLFLNVLIASIPVLMAGLAFHFIGLDLLLRSSLVIAVTTLIFAFFLWHSDQSSEDYKTLNDIHPKTAFLIGLAQIFALIPGVSRSGITMTVSRYMKLDRKTSARFSMLLSLPVIGSFGLYALMELVTQSDMHTEYNWKAALIVAVLSFISAYIVIHVFMQLISKIGFGVFALYRLVLGLGLLAYLFFLH